MSKRKTPALLATIVLVWPTLSVGQLVAIASASLTGIQLAPQEAADGDWAGGPLRRSVGGPFEVSARGPVFELANAACTGKSTGTMTVARQSERETLLNNRAVLVTGGEKSVHTTATILETAALYDPSTVEFAGAGTMTDGRVFHTATPLGSGGVLIAGGEDRIDNPVDSAEFYDASTHKFTATTGTMNESRAFHVATLLE